MVEADRVLGIARHQALETEAGALVDRAANNALHTIVLIRVRFDARTQAYVDRRTKEELATTGPTWNA